MRSTPLVAILSALHDKHDTHCFRDLRSPLWIHIKTLDEKKARDRVGIDEKGERRHFACPLIECSKWYKKRGWLANHISKKHSHLRHSQQELWKLLMKVIDENLITWDVPDGLPLRTSIYAEDNSDADAINAADHDE